MDDAARTPAVAGLFGGSGNHTVQIVVLIAVAILFIGYFGFRFVGGGRGGTSAHMRDQRAMGLSGWSVGGSPWSGARRWSVETSR
jgi:hypothetical protein